MRKSFLRKGTKVLTVVLLTTLGMQFVSCSKSDDDSNQLENNLPDAAQAFVGYWTTTGYNGTSGFVFFPNGTCWKTYYAGCSAEGFWTYNESTMILATTIEDYQWQITLSNSESWAGIYIAPNKAVSFSRSSDVEYRSLLFTEYSTWSDKENKVKLTYNSKNQIWISYDNNTLSFATKEMKDDFTYVGSLYSPYGGMQQTIAIKNPYDPSKVSIKLSGEVNATLYPVK